MEEIDWQPVEWSFDSFCFLSSMSLRRFFQRIRKRDAHKSSLENDRLGTPSNATMAPAHTLPGSDSVRLPDEDTLGSLEVTTPDYGKSPYGNQFFPQFSFVWILLVYYRIYAEDGALPSTTPVAPGNPFLGRIKIRSVPPPRTVETVKSSIAKVENIKDRESTALYLTPYSQSPMDDTEKVTILNGTGPGSTPQEPLALVAKMTDSERRALESRGRGGLASSSKPSSTSPEIRYGMSIHHSPSFLFVTVGGSVLSALRRRLWNSIESSLYSKAWGAFPWTYQSWFRSTAA